MREHEAERIVNLSADIMMIAGRMKVSAPRINRDSPHPGTEFAILDTVLRQGCETVPGIAAFRGVARQTVQVAVNRMIENGMLALAENPHHKSSKRIEVQPKGLEEYDRIRSFARRNYQASERRLKKGDFEATERVLAVIAQSWGVDVSDPLNLVLGREMRPA